MREIKFRAIPNSEPDIEINDEHWLYNKSYFDGTFIYGFIVGDHIVGKIIESDCDGIAVHYWMPIKSNTIGQFTGLQDKYGNDLYEGDKIFDEHREYWGYVEFDEGCFHAVLENVCYKLFEVQDEIQVIGNIYEDEELVDL